MKKGISLTAVIGVFLSSVMISFVFGASRELKPKVVDIGNFGEEMLRMKEKLRQAGCLSSNGSGHPQEGDPRKIEVVVRCDRWGDKKPQEEKK